MRGLSLTLTLALIIASLLLPSAHAQGITAQTDKSVYSVGEPITLTIRNNGPNKVDITAWAYLDGNLLASAVFLTYISPGAVFTSTETASQPGSYKYEFRATDTVTNASYWATVQFQVTSQPSGPAFDFAIQLAPQSAAVEQGKTANYQVLLTYSNPAYSGTTITIQVTGLGPGITYQLIPSSSTLSVFTSKSTPPGTYTIILIGSAKGVSHQTSAYLTVTAEQPSITTTTAATSMTTTATSDFSISASPSDASIFQGESASFSLIIDRMGDYDQGVTLTAFGLPTGASALFSPASGKPRFTATLTISATEPTPSGSYAVTIDASGGGKAHSATVTLIIKQKPMDTATSTTSTQGPETTTGQSDFSALVTNPLNLAIIAVAAVAIAVIGRLSARKKPSTQLPQGPTRYCAYCGATLKPKTSFCGSCGKRVETT